MGPRPTGRFQRRHGADDRRQVHGMPLADGRMYAIGAEDHAVSQRGFLRVGDGRLTLEDQGSLSHFRESTRQPAASVILPPR